MPLSSHAQAWLQPDAEGLSIGTAVEAMLKMLRSAGRGRTAILDGFGDVGWFRLRGTGQVGNGERDFKDAVIGAGRKTKTRDGLRQKIACGLIKLAELLHFLGRHLGVAVEPGRTRKPLALAHARPVHPLADRGRGLSRGFVDK